MELPHIVPGDLELDVLKVCEELLKLFQVAFHKTLPQFIDGFVSLQGQKAFKMARNGPDEAVLLRTRCWSRPSSRDYTAQSPTSPVGSCATKHAIVFVIHPPHTVQHVHT